MPRSSRRKTKPASPPCDICNHLQPVTHRKLRSTRASRSRNFRSAISRAVIEMPSSHCNLLPPSICLLTSQPLPHRLFRFPTWRRLVQAFRLRIQISRRLALASQWLQQSPALRLCTASIPSRGVRLLLRPLLSLISRQPLQQSNRASRTRRHLRSFRSRASRRRSTSRCGCTKPTASGVA